MLKNSISAALCASLLALFAAAPAGAADHFTADRHLGYGLKCETCHGPDMKNPNYPDETTCLQCHKREDVAAKTKQLEPNPHTAPHNNDCTLCHMQHEPEVNYCEQCHKFNYKMKH